MNLTFYYWSLGAAVMSLVVIRKLNNEVTGRNGIVRDTYTRIFPWMERKKAGGDYSS